MNELQGSPADHPMMPEMFWQPMHTHQSSMMRTSTCSQARPEGQQNESLSSAARKGLMIADNAVFGMHQVHFDKGAGKAEKAAVVAGEARTVAGQALNIAATANVAVWAGNKLANGSLPADSFTKSFQALGGIGVATQGLSFIKSSGEAIYHAVRDISAHNDRTEAQELLKDYDAETRSFKTPGDNEYKKERLEALLGNKKADLSRSKAQTAADRLLEVKDLAKKGAGLASSALFLAGNTSAVAAKAAPGVGVVVGAVSTVLSAAKTGVQISALNNLAKAEAATEDPLLKAVAGHIKQERTIAARKNLVNTAVEAISTAAGIGLLASGVGAPAGLIVAGAIGTAVSVSTLAYDGYHNRKLAKTREKSDELLRSQELLPSLAKQNIGVAEKAFLTRLRTSQGEELESAVKFLRDFGLTDNTIKKLQLAPEEKAMMTLRKSLYSDKVKFKGLQLKQTVKTLAHVSGLTALGRKIKAGTQWLKAKLTPSRQTDGISSVGHSIFYEPVRIETTESTSKSLSGLRRGFAVKRNRPFQTHFFNYQEAWRQDHIRQQRI